MPELPLLDASGNTLHKYGYYVRLETVQAWRVPILHGKLPGVPDSTSKPCEKGQYGLCMMCLFRPYRDAAELVRWSMRSHDVLLRPSKTSSPVNGSTRSREDFVWRCVCMMSLSDGDVTTSRELPFPSSAKTRKPPLRDPISTKTAGGSA